MNRLLDPPISIIVTNYNYGHYLGSCLDSILNQTRAADQVIVVDDGSTDGSAAILARYGAAIEVISQANGGQASAFNRGFAASLGDLVLFLDADDRLKPEAIETILGHWHHSLGHLSFRLETIDEAGCSLGLHPGSIHAKARDNRPRILRNGTFWSPPTSGNVFSRSALDAAMPMPEQRWRINADAYVLRAAALFAPSGHIPRTLGEYRLHGANNYARINPEAHDHSINISNQHDIADALDDMAAAPNLLTGPEEEDLRRDLAASALAIRDKLRDTVVVAAAPVAASISTAGLRAGPPPQAAKPKSEIYRSRRLARVSFGETFAFDQPGAHRDWLRNAPGRIGLELDLRLPPAPGTLAVTLRLRWDHQPSCPVIVTADGATVANKVAVGEDVTFTLRRDVWAVERLVEITVTPAIPNHPVPELVQLDVTDRSPLGPAPLLSGDTMVAAGPALRRGLDPTEWEIRTDDAVWLRGSEGNIRLSVPPGRAVLRLDLGASPAPGWLTIRTHDAVLFAGDIGATRILEIPLTGPNDSHVDLELSFASVDPERTLRIAQVSLRHDAGPSWSAPVPALALGELVSFPASIRTPDILDTGWSPLDGGAVCNAAAEAFLAVPLPRGGRNLVLHVALAPQFETVEGLTHIVGISCGGEMLITAELLGAGELAVPLPDPKDEPVTTLAVHSVYAGMTEAGGHAAVELTSIRLEGRKEQDMAGLLPPSALQEYARPRHAQILSQLEDLLAAEPYPERMPTLIRLRTAMVDFLSTADPAMLVTLAANPETLSTIDAVGAATGSEPLTPPDRDALAMDVPAMDEPQKLRAVLIGMLLVPAHDGPLGGRLEDFPAPLLCCAEVVGAYLGRPPELADAAARRRHSDYVDQLLASIEETLFAGPDASAFYDLAAATLRNFRITPLIFGEGNLRVPIRRLARSVERLLLADGARLWTPRRSRSGAGRLRIGVLVRDVLPNPEGWALLGMYGALDRTRFEPILIRMERGPDAVSTGDRFEGEMCLADCSIAQAVERIRDAGLDLLVTGCYALGWEKVTGIIAHRLAPLQVWHGSVCPTTGGLRSFDAALSFKVTETHDPQRHYVEPLRWIDVPRHVAFDFAATGRPGLGQDRTRLRAELGVAPDQVLFASGAVAHKIDDRLLGAWARVLKAVPDAVLALYPFAPNWAMDTAREAFERRVAAADLPSDQVILLPTLPPTRVSEVLTAADLYFDSFPYTGSTTPCEALSCGTPAICCAGDALRELTGPSWARAFGTEELIASDLDEYALIAIKLAQDTEARKGLRHRVASAAALENPPHCDKPAYGAAYADTLWQLAEESGLFPDLKTFGKYPGHTASPMSKQPKASQGLNAKAARPAAPRLGRAPTRKFAILASPRTGSTLLCAALNQTPGVTCHFELFHQEIIQYRTHQSTDPAELATRDADPVSFLEGVFAEGSAAGTDLIGFKHFGHLSIEISRAVIEDPEMYLVVLCRDNMLAQYSSEQIARQTGEWVSHRGDDLSFPTVEFDRSRFEDFERYQRRIERERQSLIAAHGRAALMLEYAKLDAEKTRARLSDYLGIAVPSFQKTDIQRQNKTVILDRFTNPDEVSSYLERRQLTSWATAG